MPVDWLIRKAFSMGVAESALRCGAEAMPVRIAVASHLTAVLIGAMGVPSVTSCIIGLKESLAMSKRATVIPLIVLVVAALLFFVINGRWTSRGLGGRAEQKTDDAYVQADMTPLSTRISGTVRGFRP